MYRNLLCELNAFASRKYNAYWFESGTPTFLINKLKETGYDIKK